MNPDLNFSSHNFVFHFQDMLLILDIGLTSSFTQITYFFTIDFCSQLICCINNLKKFRPHSTE